MSKLTDEQAQDVVNVCKMANRVISEKYDGTHHVGDARDVLNTVAEGLNYSELDSISEGIL